MFEQEDKKISYVMLIRIVGNPELFFFCGIPISAIHLMIIEIQVEV